MVSRRRQVALLACMSTAACVGESPLDDRGAAPSACTGKCDSIDADDPPPVRFQICEGEAPPAVEATADWRHLSSALVARGTPWHSGLDVIATTEGPPTLRAKLSYGSVSKDLEDEWVEVWLDRCGELELVGTARTDHDGRVALRLDDVPPVGRHRVHFRVGGDGSGTSATLHVLPPGSRVTVFDIDGTLTTSDWELFADLIDDLFEPLLAGSAPHSRDGAAATTWARHDQGYVVVYLTGRPYWLTARTRAWLADRDMAPGALITPQRSADVVPTTAGVGAFKADVLAELELLDLRIDVAYGNAATDVFAYDDAAIAPDATFILGRHGGELGTVALGDDYLHHLEAEAFSRIAQPFDRAQ